MHICCIYIKQTSFYKTESNFRSYNRDFRNVIEQMIPMGISYISSCLKKAGHETEILFYNIQQKDIYTRIKETDKLVLLSIISEGDYEIAKGIIKEIKIKYPKIKVGVGGPYPTLVPEDMISNEDIDMVCIGEGEIADVEYAKQVEEDKYKKTDNLWIRDNDGQIIKCDKSVVIEDIDSLPYPDRDSWISVFGDDFKQKQTIQYVLLERGCNNRCIYCSHHALASRQEGKYLRYRNIDKVIEEIEYLCSTYPNTITVRFNVDNSLSDPEYFIELCKKLIIFNKKREANNKAKIYFSSEFNVVPSVVKRQQYVVDLMKKANITTINIALESVSLEVRKKLNRPYYTNEQFLEFCKCLKEANIDLIVNILYNPCLFTRKIYKDTVNFLAKVQISLLQLQWLKLLKGTVLYEQYRDKVTSYKDAKLIDKWRFKTLKHRIFYKTYGLKKFVIEYSPINDMMSFMKEKINKYLNEKIEKKNTKYMFIAKQYMDKNEYKRAVKYFNKIKIKEDNYWIYGDRAIAKMNIRDYKGAIEDFNKVLVLEPKEIYKEKKEECKKLLDKNRG